MPCRRYFAAAEMRYIRYIQILAACVNAITMLPRAMLPPLRYAADEFSLAACHATRLRRRCRAFSRSPLAYAAFRFSVTPSVSAQRRLCRMLLPLFTLALMPIVAAAFSDIVLRHSAAFRAILFISAAQALSHACRRLPPPLLPCWRFCSPRRFDSILHSFSPGATVLQLFR
jgi:hypothetical protein